MRRRLARILVPVTAHLDRFASDQAAATSAAGASLTGLGRPAHSPAWTALVTAPWTPRAGRLAEAGGESREKVASLHTERTARTPFKQWHLRPLDAPLRGSVVQVEMPGNLHDRSPSRHLLWQIGAGCQCFAKGVAAPQGEIGGSGVDVEGMVPRVTSPRFGAGYLRARDPSVINSAPHRGNRAIDVLGHLVDVQDVVWQYRGSERDLDRKPRVRRRRKLELAAGDCGIVWTMTLPC